MRSSSLSLTIAATSLLLLAAAPVHAQAFRTWVSGVGDDANPCSRTAPCKTFAGAISKTATGGIIDALDPAGFGAVTITKSIMIDGGPFQAGVLAAGTNAIIINNSVSIVTLRNLNIEGIGTGLIGINILAASRVFVEGCEVHGFKGGTARGLSDTRSAGGALMVRDSTFRDNGSGAVVAPTAGGIGATFVNCHFFANVTDGLKANSGGLVTVERSVADVNGGAGFIAGGTGAASTITIMRCRSTNNGNGIQAASGGTARVGDTLVVDNGAALNTAGGTISSWGNNYIIGSGAFNGPGLTFS